MDSLQQRHVPPSAATELGVSRAVVALATSEQQPHFHLPTFEGPLDLLLQLIRENEVDIYDIPIAEITRQYLDRLAEWQALNLTVAGEYLVMAATLLEIKSRMLLPRPPAAEQEEPDPRAELARRLAEYQQYADLVETFRAWEAYRQQLYFRTAADTLDDYVLPVEASSLGAVDLAAALRRLLESAGVPGEQGVSAIVPRQRISLKLKMAEVMRAVRRSPDGVTFNALVEVCSTLGEVVVTFLAVLELLRSGRVVLIQRRPFGQLRVKRAGTDGGDSNEHTGARERSDV